MLIDRQEHRLSQRTACRVLSLSRSVYNHRPNTQRDQPVIGLLQELAEKYPRYGFGKHFDLIRRRGHKWNHKRVLRIYCDLKPNFCRKGKKRLPSRNPEPLCVPGQINQCWAIDFMSDSLWCGRRFRTFNVLDDFNREVLAIDVDLNLPIERVIRTLERIIAWRRLSS